MEQVLEYIRLHGTEVLAIVTQVVGAFAIVATLTPNSVDNRIAQVIMDIVNFLGGNFGNAKNEE